MSFIYSQALEAAFSAASCSGIDAFVPSSGSPTLKLSLSHDKTMEPSRLSRFGMTCKPLTDDRGAELLTWWRAGFHARTSVLQEKAQESPESVQGCGPTWRESLARFDPDSCSWKTVQLSLLGDSELSSVIWPRSGMTADGQCWELPMLGHRIKGTGSGSWPTPCATDASNRQIHGQVHVTAGGLPKHIGKSGKLSQMRLSQDVKMWPTPTVCGNHNRKGASATSGDGLATAVRTWPTPIARDCRTVKGGARSPNSLGTEPLITQVAIAEERTDGALNPQFVEWLMGWPIGHTDLKPLETARCPSVQPQHGECLEGSE